MQQLVRMNQRVLLVDYCNNHSDSQYNQLIIAYDLAFSILTGSQRDVPNARGNCRVVLKLHPYGNI